VTQGSKLGNSLCLQQNLKKIGGTPSKVYRKVNLVDRRIARNRRNRRNRERQMAVQRSRTRDFVSRRKHEKQHFTGLTRDGSGAGPSPPQKTNIGFSGDPGVRARLAGSATHSVRDGSFKGGGSSAELESRVSDALFRTENPELAQGPGKI
jgi:hypothetical protein